MNRKEKIAFLDKNHWKEFTKTYNRVLNTMSDKQSMFCVCGKLATGLHESGCIRFRNKVMAETLKELKHLL